MRYVRKIIPSVIVLTFCCTALSSAATIAPTLHLLLSSTDTVRLVKNFTTVASGWAGVPSAVFFHEQLWFPAPSEEYGVELWRSDGTASGTRLAADINPGPDSSSPFSLVVYKDALYFFAEDTANGLELRKTFWDNTLNTYRTVLVADIFPGPGSCTSPEWSAELVVFQDFLFFVADGGTAGKKVWRSNGTTLGTVRVADINPGSGNADPEYLTVLSNPSTGDNLVFSAKEGAGGRELWKIEKKSSPPWFIASRIKDINPGNSSSRPSPLMSGLRYTEFNEELYFSADDGEHGEELWKTDGSLAGTVMVKDIKSGSDSGLPNLSASIFNDELYFTAEEGEWQELWKTDGTAVGTVKVHSPASPVEKYRALVNFSSPDGLYFSTGFKKTASDEMEVEMLRRYWDESSSSWQTTVVSDTFIAFPEDSFYPARISILVNGEMYFSCAYNIQESSVAYGLCKTNGEKTVTEIKGGYQLDSTLARVGFIPFKNRLYFFAGDGKKKMMLLTL